MATSKLLESPYSHIKGNSVQKVCCMGRHALCLMYAGEETDQTYV